MKSNSIYIGLFLVSIASAFAQEKTTLHLKDAVALALKNSTVANLANTKAETKKLEWKQLKDNQYPDVKMAGQYMRLTSANIDMKSSSSSSTSSSSTAKSSPKVNQLAFGSVNASLPIFSGGKIRNSILASENVYKAELAQSEATKEDLIMKIVAHYADLYRAQKAVDLIQENLKSAAQRVTDFKNLEQNGIIARNDLLKAQLQQSTIQLSLDEANKNVAILNYALVTLLKLPEDYIIGIDENQFDGNGPLESILGEEKALQNRKDLEAIRFYQKANENSIKIAKSNYFPSLSLSGGYIALSLQNVVDVTNAMNFGVGVSYNLSSLFKTVKEVKVAKSKAEEMKQTEALLTENIKIQTQEAQENFLLAYKQNKVYQEAIIQATENYRIVKDKYDNGLANANDLLEADVEQLHSKINFAYSRANILLKYYEMQAASGILISSFNLTK